MTHANWVIKKKLMKGRLHKIIYNLAGRAPDTLQLSIVVGSLRAPKDAHILMLRT